MKIVFCIDAYEPSRGGAESYLRDLAAGLARRGHRIFIAAPDAEPQAAPQAAPRAAAGLGVELLPVPVPARPRLRREARLARTPLDLAQSGGFDVVVAFRHALGCDLFQPHGGLHADSLAGAVRAAAAGRTLRKLLYLRRLLSPKNLFFLHADRVLLRRNPPKVAALSHMTAAAVRERFGRQVDISVIPNGVDTGRFHPGLREQHRQAVRAELGVAPDAPVALFCGHNFALKGLGEALRGAAAFRAAQGDLDLLVAGRGRPENFRRLAKRLGLGDSVRFLGARQDLDRLYGAADVLLHPTWYDPCSLVVLEALGAGIPVITTRFNGASELMTSGREGIVLDDPRDAAAVGRALAAVLGLQHDSFRQEAGELGRRCDFKMHLDRMEDLLARCAAEKSAPRR